jgi:hypothetical protein
MMSSQFRIDFTTHEEFAHLAVEISFQGQRLCQMYRPKDTSAIEIEFIDDRLILESAVRLRFPLRDFLSVIQRARAQLISRSPAA